MDRRISKTKNTLKSALIELMEKKNYKDISVTELCNHSNINRGTFYLHYESVDNLVNELESDLQNSINNIIATHYPVRDKNFRPLLEELISFVKSEKDFISVLIGKNGDFNFIRKSTRYYRELVLNLNTFTPLNTEDQKYLNFYTSFLVEGSAGVVYEWIKNDCKDDFIDIIKQFEKILFKISQ